MKNFYHKTINGIKNLIHYFKIVWNHQNWDYSYILKMLQFQLKDLEKECKRYTGVYYNTPELSKIIRILDRITNDHYYESAQFLQDMKRLDEVTTDENDNFKLPALTSEQINEFLRISDELENADYEEFFELIKKIREWWI